MAIYSLNHSAIGKTTQKRPGTAAAHVDYITRPRAAGCVMAERMPANRNQARAWLLEQEAADRKNARVIDKVMVALPRELDATQRVALARDFAAQATAGRAPWLAAIHDKGKDAANPHAHLVIRDRDAETAKRAVGLSEKGSIEWLRELWEATANKHLAAAGHDARIDRRTLKAQRDEAIKRGDLETARTLDREPQIHVGPRAKALQERGDRPVSRIRRGRRGREIDYPLIDVGRSRGAYNAAIKARNAQQAARRAREAARQAAALERAKLAGTGRQRQEEEDTMAAQARKWPQDERQALPGGKETEEVPGGLQEAKKRHRMAEASALIAAAEARRDYKAVLYTDRWQGELPEHLRRNIAYVDAIKGRVVLWDGSEVLDQGNRILSTAGHDEALSVMVQMARDKGFRKVTIAGRDAGFKRRAVTAMLAAGIGIANPELQDQVRAWREAREREAPAKRIERLMAACAAAKAATVEAETKVAAAASAEARARARLPRRGPRQTNAAVVKSLARDKLIKPYEVAAETARQAARDAAARAETLTSDEPGVWDWLRHPAQAWQAAGAAAEARQTAAEAATKATQRSGEVMRRHEMLRRPDTGTREALDKAERRVSKEVCDLIAEADDRTAEREQAEWEAREARGKQGRLEEQLAHEQREEWSRQGEERMEQVHETGSDMGLEAGQENDDDDPAMET